MSAEGAGGRLQGTVLDMRAGGGEWVLGKLAAWEEQTSQEGGEAG